MPIMLWIAAIVEYSLGNVLDGGILTAINLMNASISYYEESKAGDAIAALKASLKPVVCDNFISTVSTYISEYWDKIL